MALDEGAAAVSTGVEVITPVDALRHRMPTTSLNGGKVEPRLDVRGASINQTTGGTGYVHVEQIQIDLSFPRPLTQAVNKIPKTCKTLPLRILATACLYLLAPLAYLLSFIPPISGFLHKYFDVVDTSLLPMGDRHQSEIVQLWLLSRLKPEELAARKALPNGSQLLFQTEPIAAELSTASGEEKGNSKADNGDKGRWVWQRWLGLGMNRSKSKTQRKGKSKRGGRGRRDSEDNKSDQTLRKSIYIKPGQVRPFTIHNLVLSFRICKLLWPKIYEFYVKGRERVIGIKLLRAVPDAVLPSIR